ncbi:MAG TPA: trehalose-6-phosphate synthase, partial [Gaiellaceae bacterium]|nr:trehalose-6-phosphate synthase [Gaiellaceae bacterium]
MTRSEAGMISARPGREQRRGDGGLCLAPLVTVANRLPVVKTRSGWRTADGGLVAALRPTFDARAGSWIGWDGGSSGVPHSLPDLDVRLAPVSLPKSEVEGFYHGFSNRTLWPLFHGLADRVVIDRRWWHDYSAANEQFAERALEVASSDSLLWVHDYQLVCVPALLRRAGAQRPIGFFLHIPFPAPELFARLPWRQHLVDGMLGADVVGFQTEEFRQNFVRTCRRLRDDIEVEGRRIRLGDGRTVLTATHPISIDASGMRDRARSESTGRAVERLRRQFAGRRVLVGIDRLDYTKGIVERFRAIELLLERRPDLRGRIAVLQIAVPSRGDIREYRELRAEVEQVVGRINGRFTVPGQDTPVHYLYRALSSGQLLAHYGIADVCLVTPLRDGMNLVAKEFVVTQDALESAGVLVLSEFAGAAEELREALPCNPFDVEGLSGSIELALELEEDDRRYRIERLARRVHRHDVFAWLDEEVGALEAVAAG